MAPWHLLPDVTNLTGFIQTAVVMLALTLAGRLVIRSGHGVSVQLAAGWGVYAVAATLWGVLTPLSLRLPAGVFFGFALLGLLRGGLRRPDLGEIGRMTAIAAPLLWVMADIKPSQSDNLAVMLPNTAYLFDWGHFPREDGPPVYTDVPVAPYNFHLLSLLGSLVGNAYAPNSPSLITVFLHLATGLILARALAGGERPGWTRTALGLGLVTLLNPGFVPRVAFSGYAEFPLAAALLFSVWTTLKVMDDLAEGRDPDLSPLILSQMVLVLIKQQGIGLFLAHLGGCLLVAGMDRRIGPRRALIQLGGAALPALIYFGVWRYYVGTAFPAGELRATPFHLWQWELLPEILADTAKVILRHPPYFLALAAAGFLLALRPPRLSNHAKRALALLLISALLYNAFLLLTFVGHFKGEHSFFRYNTHQSLILMLALALAARDLWPPLPANRLRWVRAAVIGGMAAAPLVAAPLLRFDRDMPQPRLYQLAEWTGTAIGKGDRLALFLPGDNNSARDALSSLLRFAPLTRPLLDIGSWNGFDARSRAEAASHGYEVAVLSCTEGNDLGLPDQAAALLEVRDGIWKVKAVWPYPAAPKRSWWNWTAFIAAEPFCLRP